MSNGVFARGQSICRWSQGFSVGPWSVCPSLAPLRPFPPVLTPRSLLLWLLRDLNIPEPKVEKVWIHVEICQSAFGFSSWSELGSERQPKLLSPRGIEMGTEGQMGKQLLTWAAQKPLLSKGWGEAQEQGAGQRAAIAGIPRLSCQHPSHICGKIYTRHQGERARPSIEYLARTVMGQMIKQAFLVTSLFPSALRNLCLVKKLGDLLYPNPFNTGPEKGGCRIRKLVAEPEICCRWNSGPGWGWGPLRERVLHLFQLTVCDSRPATQDGHPIRCSFCSARLLPSSQSCLNSRIIPLQGDQHCFPNQIPTTFIIFMSLFIWCFP